MGPLRHPGLARLAFFAWLVGCSTTALMDSMEDDMAGSRSGESVQSACSACFENICAWQTTECAADPGCATWLTCAKEMALAEAEDPECSKGLGPTATSLKDALVRCIDSTRCCDGPSDGGPDLVDSEAPPTGVGGSGGQAGSGGSAGGENYDSSSTCTECVKVQCDVSACDSSDGCITFLGKFSTCVKEARMSNAGDARALEACLFPFALDAYTSGGLQAFLDVVFDCINDDCSGPCTLDPGKVCAACQQSKCLSEYSSVFTDASAVLGLWCRSYCQRNPEDGDCAPSVTGGLPAKCEGYLQDNMELLAPYLQCVQLSCGEEC